MVNRQSITPKIVSNFKKSHLKDFIICHNQIVLEFHIHLICCNYIIWCNSLVSLQYKLKVSSSACTKKTKPICMCIDIPIVNSKPIRSPFHKKFLQQVSSFLWTVHLVIIFLRQVRYNKNWGYVRCSEPQTLRLCLNFANAISTKP